MNRDLAGLCLEHKTCDTDEVADIHEALEHLVVQIFILVGANVVTGNVDLNAAFRVLQLHEACLAHHAAAHHAAGNAHGALFALSEICLYLIRKSIGGILCCWIRIDAHVAQFLQTLSSYNLLFA